MHRKSGILAANPIMLHPESAHGDAGQLMLPPKLLHEVIPIPIRQAQIADDQIKMLMRRDIRGRRGVGDGIEPMAEQFEQFRQRHARIVVVFDQEDLQASPRLGQSRRSAGRRRNRRRAPRIKRKRHYER